MLVENAFSVLMLPRVHPPGVDNLNVNTLLKLRRLLTSVKEEQDRPSFCRGLSFWCKYTYHAMAQRQVLYGSDLQWDRSTLYWRILAHSGVPWHLVNSRREGCVSIVEFDVLWQKFRENFGVDGLVDLSGLSCSHCVGWVTGVWDAATAWCVSLSSSW